MNRTTALCAATFFAATLTACNSSRDANIKAIRDTETEWNQAFVFRNPDKIVSYYADDAILKTPAMPAINGKPAIAKAIKAMLADPALSLQFSANSIEVARDGDIAYTQGAYSMTLTDPHTNQPIHDHGSYVTTYRKQSDGSWKAVADIASSDVPSQAPSSSPSPTLSAAPLAPALGPNPAP